MLHAILTRKHNGVVWLGLPVQDEVHIGDHLLDLLPCAAQRLDLGVHKHLLDAVKVELPHLDVGLH